MDKQYGKVSNLALAAIIFLSSGMIIHVMIMPILLDTSGKDAWISVLIAGPFFLLWLFLLFGFIKYLNGKPFIKWVKEKWGIIGLIIVSTISLLFLIFISIHTLVDTMIWTISSYMQNTPFYIIGFGLLIVCIFLAYSGFQSIAITASLLLPVVSFLGFFVSTMNQQHKDYSLLLPLFDNGVAPVLQGAYYAIIALGDCWMILLFSHYFKTKPTKTYTIFFGCFLIMLFIGPIIGGITEFGAEEASLQRYTAFDQWKLISIGRLLQHVDFLSIFQWLSGSLIRISLAIFLISEILPTKQLHIKKMVFFFIFIALAGSMFYSWRADLILSMITTFFIPSGAIILPTMTLLIVITCWIEKLKKRKTN